MASYKKQIQAITGYTDEQYKREYTQFAARVRNYNAIAGTNYKASHAFYISKKYAGDLSRGIQDILNTPATRTRSASQSIADALGATAARVEQAAISTIRDRWSNFIEQSRQDLRDGFGSGRAARIADQLNAGKITPKQANEALKALKEQASTRRSKDPTYKY